MIVGLGVDVVELDRIKRSWTRFGTRFSDKILTEHERSLLPESHINNIVAYLGARFAAKEAGSKALGTGFRNGVNYHGIEVRRSDLGKPELVFREGALEIADAMGVLNTHITLTHGRDVAVAVVVLEK